MAVVQCQLQKGKRGSLYASRIDYFQRTPVAMATVVPRHARDSGRALCMSEFKTYGLVLI